jgi:hypothetical protein
MHRTCTAHAQHMHSKHSVGQVASPSGGPACLVSPAPCEHWPARDSSAPKRGPSSCRQACASVLWVDMQHRHGYMKGSVAEPRDLPLQCSSCSQDLASPLGFRHVKRRSIPASACCRRIRRRPLLPSLCSGRPGVLVPGVRDKERVGCTPEDTRDVQRALNLQGLAHCGLWSSARLASAARRARPTAPPRPAAGRQPPCCCSC